MVRIHVGQPRNAVLSCWWPTPGPKPSPAASDLARFPTPAAVRVCRTSGPDGGETLVESPPGAFSVEVQTLTCAAPAYSLTTIAIDFTITTTLRSRLKHPIP